MNKNRKNHGRPQRRFCHATDGPEVRQRYAYMPIADLARELGLTVKQIENYTFRHNSEPWTRKQPSVVSCSNRENGKKAADRRIFSNKKANTFFVPDILHLFAAENHEL